MTKVYLLKVYLLDQSAILDGVYRSAEKAYQSWLTVREMYPNSTYEIEEFELR